MTKKEQAKVQEHQKKIVTYEAKINYYLALRDLEVLEIQKILNKKPKAPQPVPTEEEKLEQSKKDKEAFYQKLNTGCTHSLKPMDLSKIFKDH